MLEHDAFNRFGILSEAYAYATFEERIGRGGFLGRLRDGADGPNGVYRYGAGGGEVDRDRTDRSWSPWWI